MTSAQIVPSAGGTNYGGGERRTSIGSSTGSISSILSVPISLMDRFNTWMFPKKPPKFGTFTGVFARCLLNIWGVIMFLRLGWMIAHAGLLLSLSIVGVAMTITTITTLSLSAICTNGIIGNGGAYFLLSRSLGPAFGGSIGVLFSIANATAVALHLVGFAETITSLLTKIESDLTIAGSAGDGLWDLRLYAIFCLIFLICVGLIGVSYVVKLQLNFLWLLIVSLVLYFIGSFCSADESIMFTGYKMDVLEDNLAPSFQGSETWITLFAVFFPASTGIMAGANISGDLKDAQKSIPKGTLWAVLVSGISYVLMLVSIASTIERGEFHDGDGSPGLYNDYLVMYDVSSWPPSIIVGIVASALSSALAALVGAPRVFQAVCEDGLFPSLTFLGKTTVVASGSPEPLRLYGVTFIVAVGIILIGDLNAIAPYITNFFMISYALINYAAFIASHDDNPGWRPKWRFYNKWVALSGAFSCIAAMVMISWYVGIITILLAFILYKYVELSPIQKNWGNVHKSLRYSQTVNNVYKLESVYRTSTIHIKNFRPAFLVMAGPATSRTDLVKYAHQLRYGKGFTVVANIVVGTFEESHALLMKEKASKYYSVNKFDVVPMAVCASSLLEGMRTTLQTAGVGILSPNTVVLNFKVNESVGSIDDAEGSRKGNASDEISYEEYVRFLLDALKMHYSFVLLKGYAHKRRRKSRDDILPEDLPPSLAGSITAKLKIDLEDAGIRRGVEAFSSELKSPSLKMGKIPYAGMSKGSSGADGALTVDTSSASKKPESPKSIGEDREYSHDGLYSPLRRKMSRTASLREIEAKGTLSRLPEIWGKALTTPDSRKGRVDVYWLCDHGGLTILLPHLLRKNPTWRELKIRVLVPASRETSPEDIEDGYARQKNALLHVLHELRIEADAHVFERCVELDVFQRCEDDLDVVYNNIDECLASDTLGSSVYDDPSKKADGKSTRRGFKDVVEQLSSDALMVYMTAPHPDVKRPKKYMRLLSSWSSKIKKVPVAYIHGSGDRVLSIEA